MTTPWQPGPQGNMITPPGYRDPPTWSLNTTWPTVVARTSDGTPVSLINGTQTVLAYQVPADGRNHVFLLCGVTLVTVAETGGAIQVAYTAPVSGATTGAPDPGGNSTLGVNSWNFVFRFAAPGSTITVTQNSALTAGTAAVIAQIWMF